MSEYTCMSLRRFLTIYQRATCANRATRLTGDVQLDSGDARELSLVVIQSMLCSFQGLFFLPDQRAI